MTILSRTLLFLGEHNKIFGCLNKVQQKPVEIENNKNKESKKGGSSSASSSIEKKGKAVDTVSMFQMPLHYLRYKKEGYEDMPEWKLDDLLADYGLFTDGDLANKREFAMGTFLWSDFHGEPKNLPSCSLEYSSIWMKNLVKKVVEFLRW